MECANEGKLKFFISLVPMALVFERIFTEGIAEISYLVGDDSVGVAAVFDPTPDADRYQRLARRKKVAITHIFETHVHADLMSGALELRSRTVSAKVYVSHEGGARYGFDHKGVKDGDTFTFGKTMITVRHTPGHTPEHVSYLLAEKDDPATPWGVLTGDSLFVKSAGRPDLLGSDQTDSLTRMLFETLREFYLTLPDSVLVYPAHGHGSPCGADISDRLESSVGYERKHNPYLQFTDFAEFSEFTSNGAPPVPTYYPVMKKLNARGPKVPGHLPRVSALPAEIFEEAIREKAGLVIDTRNMLAFGGGHIQGALNIEATPLLSIWAGWLLEIDEPLLLVLESDAKLEEVLTLLMMTGYTNIIGYLVGGMTAWSNSGLPLVELRQISVHEVRKAGADLQIVDVRAPDEWEKGHIPGAIHRFLPELRERTAGLKKTKPVALYCGSGYRASIGASILQQEGFRQVHNIPGSWQAWEKAGYPVEGGAGA